MTTVALALPIQPGKLTLWRAFQTELRGNRLAAYAAHQARCGITAEQTFLQATPEGDIALTVIDCADYGQVVKAILSSTDPFTLWYMDQLDDLYGLTPAIFAQVRPGQRVGEWNAKLATGTGRLDR